MTGTRNDRFKMNFVSIEIEVRLAPPDTGRALVEQVRRPGRAVVFENDDSFRQLIPAASVVPPPSRSSRTASVQLESVLFGWVAYAF